MSPARAQSRQSGRFDGEPGRSGSRARNAAADLVWTGHLSPVAPGGHLAIVRRCSVRSGGVAEWLKAHAWNACVRETVPWVRIPLPPPERPPLSSAHVDEYRCLHHETWLLGAIDVCDCPPKSGSIDLLNMGRNMRRAAHGLGGAGWPEASIASPRRPSKTRGSRVFMPTAATCICGSPQAGLSSPLSLGH